MQNLINALIICSATMSLLVLLFLILSPLLSKRYSAKWQYYAWLFIVIGFIVPWRPHLDFEFFKLPAQIKPIVIPQPFVQNITPMPIIGEQAGVSAISWPLIVFLLWLAVTLCIICYQAINHYRFMRMVKRWSDDVTDEQALGLLQKLKTKMGISKQIYLQMCPCIGSPMMIGFVNTRILLPAINLSKDELGFIIKHELVHYRRKDLWYKCLVLVATAIHWFNPLIYLMVKAIDAQCELSCDDEVVQSTNANLRQQYIETIIGVVRYRSKWKTALSTNFYGGKRDMKKRIFSIMDTTKKKAGMAIVSSVLLLTIGTGMIFAASTSPVSQSSNAETTAKETDKSIAGEGAHALSDKEIEQMFADFDRANAGVYTVYEKYGLTYNNDENRLYYDGKLVRYFEDNQNTDGTFGGVTSANADGSIDVHSVRNSAGELTGVEAYKQTDYDARTAELQK